MTKTNLVKGETGDWEMVIGLEIHAQITANSKLFSGSSAAFGAEPNTQVSLVDAAMPGMLPVINQVCIEQAVRTGLGLKAQINKYSVFERKNYFYPDLPQGYQISQMAIPVVGKGQIEIDLEDGSTKVIGITRLHMEQDAGKSIHDISANDSHVDLNRSGCALMEIVSEPDMRSAEEAGAYVKKIRSILRYLETCDGNMEEGSMRCDVNLSMRRVGAPLGTRCEIKNVNSIRHMMNAIAFEADRQIEILEKGEKVSQETRLWDPNKNETRSMRSKEDAMDYRYFPDPDLLPLRLSDELIERIKKSLPELPDEKKHKFIKEFGLSVYDASVLTAERDRAEFYERAISKGRDPKIVANWLVSELLGALNKQGLELSQSPISADQLGELVELITNNTISGKIAKDVFADVIATGKNPSAIVEEKGLKQVTDVGAIEAMVDKIIAANPSQVEAYKSGKVQLFGFFVGQVLKESQGKANPEIVNELLKKKLS